MSVLVTDRKESKLEAITFSLELHDMLIQFMQRSFGVKNFEKVIRSKYGDSTDPGQEMSNSRFLMHRFKVRINDTAMLLTSNVRAANSIYPTTLHECDVRRDYQNAAIGNCEQLIKDLQQIVEGFQIDVSYMSDDEYEHCMENLFNKLEYREIPRYELTGDKMMAKSVNIGDQLSQIIGIYYPHRIDNYIKYVESEKFYGRYMDDWYIMSPDKARLEYLLTQIEKIATELGIHINMKKTKIVKISSTYKFLQVKYSLRRDGKIIKRINPKRVTALRRKLKKLSLKVQNGEIPYIYVENMFKGWMGSYYKLLSKAQRKNLLLLFEELFGKSITISNKKLIIVDKEDSVDGWLATNTDNRI